MYKIFVFILVYFDFSIFIVYVMKEVEQLWFILYDISDIECRIIYFIGYVVFLMLYVIIVVIVIERYRKICYLLKFQMFVFMVKCVCLVCVGFVCVSGLFFFFMIGNWYVIMEGCMIF